ncbi:M42 family metallopeptidase [Anaerosalibacter bizertensis]|uniref:M42 family metallopeptidase n=1 Tax=Anaerosalibacter bizertensis TaxID=932217 RepID=A0A844FG39_9FIRM|nr:M42 family metallopeptidase [Anaerosalibacter bizertensis]MBV1818475.1 M42 family metallopeptidase [Bacteroidales bacterium MSK.15.36]MCG4564284.1 M42 family metallopeptidase [Anaerosalibacter bizertensis]MCG4582809.1 M42 family metallopeptidase [Anaerosalibacter bizertensis]MSS42925.1 M42 family metallopeptidase [Anaerosalibacter bizertensis]
MNFNSELAKKLVNIYSPSGDENNIREFIKDEIKDFVDEVEIDSLGNLIARKKGKGKKIMLAAHMDQIGLMVTDIDDKGFLRFTNIGGISPVLSLGQKVIFKNGTVGVIFAEPVDNIGKLKLENMFIDIGVLNKEEAEKKVSIGDICVYESGFSENDNVIFSKCLDDRIGCFVLIETLKRVKNSDNDLYFVFTVQEEVGLRGARTSAYKINPDLGIAIDVTSSGDTPKAKRFAVSLNKGTAIKVKDNSILTHPKVRELMAEVAEENSIPYQMEVLEFGGTDSGAIHLTREGIPTGAISIPTRYVHSTVEMSSKKDINYSVDLLVKLLEKTI